MSDPTPVSASRRRLLIRGRVQGVSFRAWTQRKASALGLAGFVRNLRDGSVEAVAEGPPDSLDAFERACRRGPLLARVDALDSTPEPPEGLRGFEVRW